MNSKCQIFTPADIVNYMLDFIGYTSDLFGKKILENACGDGNILSVIVNRYIEDALKNNLSKKIIKNGIESDIFAYEIDSLHFNNCIKKLNEICNKYSIFDVKWNIYNRDYLKETLCIKLDFIVGNPPYISYLELDKDNRSFIRQAYKTCNKGKFDYCYAFIEHSIQRLSSSGKMAYLVPSNIFKNVYGNQLRQLILPMLSDIVNYTTKKIFTGTLTSSSVLLIDKSLMHKKLFSYTDVVKNTTFSINKSSLNDKWVFSDYSNVAIHTKRETTFGEHFHAAITIATLLNKAYIIHNWIDEDGYVIVDNNKIEKSILRNTFSPRSLMRKKGELIIFPYYYDNGILHRFSEKQFLELFPFASQYLRQFFDELILRDSEKSCKWFEYGRHQALQHLNQEKLLLSTVITNKVRVYKLNANDIPYSGIYITPKSDKNLDMAKTLLESTDFIEYVKGIGINANGLSLRITSKDINNYTFKI